MDYAQLLAKCDELQEVIDKTHESLENLVVLDRMPPSMQLEGFKVGTRVLKNSLLRYISEVNFERN